MADLVHRSHSAADTMCGQTKLTERVTVVDEDITCPGCLEAMRARNVEDILSGPHRMPFYDLPADRDA